MVPSESLQRKFYAALLIILLVEYVQSLFGSYPQVFAVLLGDVVDTTEYLGVVDLYVCVVADVE